MAGNKEHAIIFSGGMVRAILDGRKSQTRRLVALPSGWEPKVGAGGRGDLDRYGLRLVPSSGSVLGPDSLVCRYGTVGDRLWVRENWQPLAERKAIYAATWHPASPPPSRWRPSIHMPRWACRITLEVTGVRVERLQDISDDDARAEGVEYSDETALWSPGNHETPTQAFAALWESIHGPELWAKNPWVWVVEFKRIEASSEAA